MKSVLRNSSRHFALLAAIAATGSFAMGADAPPGKQEICDKVLHATQIDDRDAFLSNATDGFKKAITPVVFNRVSKILSPHLSKGFETSYLCNLKQGARQVYLWKVIFNDGYNDMLLRVYLRDGQLDGCLIQ
ncbi:MAG TPA: hypothetical protein VG722_05610 [Tepidisphaeraceae bacterium]|nr:hypothetical protein [Tepidisphaeraceae bacterium]